MKTGKAEEGVGWNCSARVAQTPVFFFGTLQDKKTKVNFFLFFHSPRRQQPEEEKGSEEEWYRTGRVLYFLRLVVE